MLSTLIFILGFFTLSTFSINLKAAFLVSDCYYPDKSQLNAIRSGKIGPKEFGAVRSEMADVLGIILPDKQKKLGWFRSILVNIYAPLFVRIGVEQDMIVRWFIDPACANRTGLRFRPAPVSALINAAMELIEAQVEYLDNGTLTKLEVLYFTHQLLLTMGKKIGVNELETIIIDPILKEMFKGIDAGKIPKKELESIANIFIKKTRERDKIKKLRYSVSLGLKSICFLHPKLSNLNQVKNFTNI